MGLWDWFLAPAPYPYEQADHIRALWLDYVKIHRRAENGETIRGKDFLDVEARFNARVRTEDLPAPAETLLDPKLDKIVTNVDMLNRAFLRQYVAFAMHRENTTLPEDVTSEAELVKTLLTNNQGLAIGEYHTQSETLKFLTRIMPAFRQAGGNTIYFESEGAAEMTELMEAAFNTANSLSDEEYERRMMSVLNDPHRQQLIKRSIAATHNVGVDEVDGDIIKALVDMARSAGKNEIRLVMIDKEGAARKLEGTLLGAHRVASTNFVWTDNIEADRQETGKEGKFLLRGGNNHFASQNDDPKKNPRKNGFVDEALGIPSLTFERPNPENAKGFRRGGPEENFDFYLPGDDDYPVQNGSWVQPLIGKDAESAAEPAPAQEKDTPSSNHRNPPKSVNGGTKTKINGGRV